MGVVSPSHHHLLLLLSPLPLPSPLPLSRRLSGHRWVWLCSLSVWQQSWSSWSRLLERPGASVRGEPVIIKKIEQKMNKKIKFVSIVVGVWIHKLLHDKISKVVEMCWSQYNNNTQNWLCLFLGLGLPEQAMGWLPLRFRIGGRRQTYWIFQVHVHVGVHVCLSPLGIYNVHAHALSQSNKLTIPTASPTPSWSPTSSGSTADSALGGAWTTGGGAKADCRKLNFNNNKFTFANAFWWW